MFYSCLKPPLGARQPGLAGRQEESHLCPGQPSTVPDCARLCQLPYVSTASARFGGLWQQLLLWSHCRVDPAAAVSLLLQGEQCDFFQWADDVGSGSKRVSGFDRSSSGANATTGQVGSQQQATSGGYGAPAAGAAWNSMGSGLNGLSYGGNSSAGAAGAAGGPAGGSGGAV